MSMSPETEALMLAYVYGELEGEAVKAFEGKLASDPDLKAEVEGMLAMRDLLDADVAYGEESGLDEPPPHLRDAIFRAEALSRPAELKVAIVSAARPDEESWVKRFGAWLLGGGALVGAAAAATLVVGLSKQEAPNVASLTAEKSADVTQAPVATPSAESAGAGPEGGAAAELAAADEEPRPASAEPEPEPVLDAAKAADALSSLSQLARKEGEARMPEPSQQAAMPLEAQDRRDMKALAGDFEDAIDAPGALVGKAMTTASENVGYDVEKKQPAERSASRPKKDAAMKSAEEEARPMAKAEAYADDDDFGAADEGAPAPAAKAAKPAPAPVPTRAPASTGVVSETRPRSIGSGFGGGAPAPAAAPSSASGPPPLPEGLKETMAKSKQKKAVKTKGGVENDRIAGAMREQKKQDAEMLLLSGFRELELGRPTEALALFERAEQIDSAGRAQGIKPIVGQMLAWQALGKPAQVLVLFARIESAGPLAEGAVQGYLVAGGAAEKLGRLADAERIYRTLGKAPKGERQAKAGLERVRAARASSEVDAAAEAE